MKICIKAPLETKEQQWVIQWANHQFFNHGQGPELIGAYLFAIPNGGSRHKAEAKRLKAEGVRAGVPDLQLVVPRNGLHGLFVEMKRRDGVPSDIKQEQKDWHYKLRQKGYAVTVAFGFDMARQAITDYLNGSDVKEIYRNLKETVCH